MTRDEAIEALRKAQPRIDTVGNCGLWLDAFVALGMLKLDEPPRPAILKEADWWCRIGGAIEVSPASVAKALDLIRRMRDELDSEDMKTARKCM